MQTMKMTQPAVKPYKGMGMEGLVARWYARSTQRDMEDFRRQAREVAAQLPRNARVLEVAPGPGYFAIELAKLGPFQITGLDISRTFVDIAQANAREEAVSVDFRHGNASAMPFDAETFDFIFCRAAFKNFSEPVEAINQMHRVLRPGGKALIVDLRKDVSMEQIDAFVKESGRSRFDSWFTKLAFRTCLIKRAYTARDFTAMANKSRFGSCRIDAGSIGLEVHFERPAA
jgi:ubiquinone/menaquinone biosynthesis C-methylase UbiE